jgi:hypothetical protein
VDSFDDLIIEMDGDDTVISFNDAATLADDTVTLVDYDNTANPLMASDFDFIIV